MKRLPANTFDAVVTDPPYELGFMGKKWDRSGVAFLPETWKEVLRVAKPGAMLLAFGGTRTYHRLACAIEDAGWEIRDCLMWLYGSGFPKSLDISKAIDKAAGVEREPTGRVLSVTGNRANGSNALAQSGLGAVNAGPQAHRETLPATDLAHVFNGYGTALKPAWEPIILAMKPLDGTFAQNAEKWGVAGVSIDRSRIGTDGGTRKVGPPSWKPGNSLAGSVRGELNGGGVEAIGKGRFPPNLLLDEEAAGVLDAQAPRTGQAAALKETGRDRPGHGRLGKMGPPKEAEVRDALGGASRFFYTAKACKSDRGEGNSHPTVKPRKLMEYLCTLLLPPDQGQPRLLLDPFAGSGSTGIGALLAGFYFVGIESDTEHGYPELARRRLVEFGEEEIF